MRAARTAQQKSKRLSLVEHGFWTRRAKHATVDSDQLGPVGLALAALRRCRRSGSQSADGGDEVKGSQIHRALVRSTGHPDVPMAARRARRGEISANPREAPKIGTDREHNRLPKTTHNHGQHRCPPGKDALHLPRPVHPTRRSSSGASRDGAEETGAKPPAPRRAPAALRRARAPEEAPRQRQSAATRREHRRRHRAPACDPWARADSSGDDPRRALHVCHTHFAPPPRRGPRLTPLAYGRRMTLITTGGGRPPTN